MKRKKPFFLIGIFFLVLAITWFVGIARVLTASIDSYSLDVELMKQQSLYDPNLQSFIDENWSPGRLTYGLVRQGHNTATLIMNTDIQSPLDNERVRLSREVPIDVATGIVLSDSLNGAHIFGQGLRKKESFLYAHPTVEEPLSLHFVDQDRRAGMTTFHFRGTIQQETGSETYPSILPATGSFQATHIVDLWVEPYTGRIVDASERGLFSEVKLKDGERVLTPWSKYEISLSESEIPQLVRVAQLQRTVLFFAYLLMPGIFIIAALTCFFLGLLPLSAKATTVLLPLGAIALFLTGVIVTVASSFLSQQLLQQRKETEFFTQSINVEESILQRMEIYRNALRGGKGLFEASEEVNQDEWRRYSEALNLERNSPGITSLGFAERQNQPNQDEGFLITHLEPQTDNNTQLLGQDLAKNASLLEAMRRSRDTAEPALSDKSYLVSEGDDRETGFSLLVPTYKSASVAASLEARRQALTGYVFSQFVVSSFISGAREGLPSDIHITMYDGLSANDEKLMYSDPQPANYTPAFRRTSQVTIDGKTWTFIFQETPSFGLSRVEEGLPIFMLISGSLMSLLLTLLLYYFARSQLYAQKNVAILESELKESQNRFTSAFLASPLGVAIIDMNETWLQVNPAFFTLTGFEQNDLSTVKPRDILCSDQQSSIIEQVTQNMSKNIATTQLETKLRKKNGQEFWCLLTVTFIFSTTEPQQPEFLVIQFQDISSSKESEALLRQHNAELEKMNTLLVEREEKMIELKKQLKQA